MPTLKSIFLSVLILLFFTNPLHADDKIDPSKVLNTAVSWMQKLDEGKIDDCYDNASPAIKNSISKKDFSKTLSGLLSPLGKFKERHWKLMGVRSKVHNAPPGTYVIIRFEAAYQNQGKVMETTTLSLDSDQTWRVAGYHINYNM